MISIKEIFNTEMEAFYKDCVKFDETSDKSLRSLFLAAGMKVMASIIADKIGLEEEAKGIEIDGDNYWMPAEMPLGEDADITRYCSINGNQDPEGSKFVEYFILKAFDDYK
jgi:hypothetical protein